MIDFLILLAYALTRLRLRGLSGARDEFHLAVFRSRARLEAEIFVLRHQLNILQRKSDEGAVFKNIDHLVFVGLVSSFSWRAG